MFNGKYVYLRKYPAQMNMYLLLDNKDYGVFILKNKSTGMLKVLDVYLDYDYAESLLKKAERINHYVDNDILPNHYSDASICDRCDFRHICLPDIGGVEFMEGRIVNMLDERQDLIELIDKSDIPDCQKRLKEINDLLKKIFEGKDSVIAGSYFITGKWRHRGNNKYWSVSVASSRQEVVNG